MSPAIDTNSERSKTMNKESTVNVVTVNETENVKFIRYKDAVKMYNICQKTLEKIVRDANAVYKVGKMVLINTKKLDSYLETFCLDF